MSDLESCTFTSPHEDTGAPYEVESHPTIYLLKLLNLYIFSWNPLPWETEGDG